MKTNKTKKKTEKTKTISNMDTTTKPGVNIGSREGQAIPVSYKTVASFT